MKHSEFQELQKKLFKDCFEIVSKKNQDYTMSNADALKHFKSASEELDITPLKLCGIYFKKHSDSIKNYIKTGGHSESEPIAERIKDTINYLTFLHAIIIENEQANLPKAEDIYTGIRKDNI